jgi:Xaa-Pro aminopeptidase
MGSISSSTFDALLITSLPNIFYLSGFTGSAAIILITQMRAILVTDGRYTIQARAQCPDFTIHICEGSGGYTQELQRVLALSQDIHVLGFEDNDLSVARQRELRTSPKKAVVHSANHPTSNGNIFQAFFPPIQKPAPIKPLRWKSASGLVEKLRFVKDSKEIELMREAIKVAQDAFSSVRHMLKEGTAEREFALELDFAMRKLGADSSSFDTIVASGPNGALPHHHPGNRKFEAGDLVTIDWGARMNGYCSDITRTVAVPGKPVNAKLREIYNVVQTAKIAAISACKAGANGKAIDSVARKIITDAGYGEYFSHSLGHSLGIVTHDGVTLSQRAQKVKLLDGVVTTVEPGIYVEGLGGVRIEEDVLVTSKGAAVLTEADNEMM